MHSACDVNFYQHVESKQTFFTCDLFEHVARGVLHCDFLRSSRLSNVFRKAAVWLYLVEVDITQA